MGIGIQRRARPNRFWAVMAATALVITLVPMTAASAEGHIQVAYSWTELTEGITVDKVGNIFVSNSPAGELWKIAPGAAEPEVFGTVEGIDAAGGDLGLIGLAVDAPGNVYGTVVSFTNNAANGVWKFDRKTGEATKAPGSEDIVLANAIAFDKRGNMYVTDSAVGAVYRIPKGGGSAELWIADETLEGTGVLDVGIPIGANGIAYRQGALFVSNTEKGSIVKIPVLRKGAAGVPSVVVEGEAIFGIDGIALDVHGDIYAAIIAQSAVRKISLGSSISFETLGEGGSGSPVLDTSSVAFGTGKGARSTLYAVNFGVFSQAVFDPDPRPAILEFDVGVAGMPLP
jgi:sugar lactone lactonase YvrE